MRTVQLTLLVAFSAAFLVGQCPIRAQDLGQTKPAVVSEASKDGSEKITIVWTSGDPEVAHRMVLMYAHAAKKAKWFNEVRIIVWGPSARLLAADKEIQAKIAEMQQDGVITQACVVCADSYGVTGKLKELKLEVLPMGEPLTNLLKDSSVKVVTF